MRTWPRTTSGCRAIRKKDQRARAQVLHEMDRRDTEAKAKDNRAHAKYSRQLEHADAAEASYVAAEDATRGEHGQREGPGARGQPADADHRAGSGLPPVRL